jgi:chromosomal replication initiator protein
LLTTEREIALALGEAIARRITPARFNLWFEGRSKFHCDGDQLTVGMPNRFLQEYVQKTYAEVVAAAAEEVLGRLVRVRFVIDPELFRAARQAEAAVEQLTFTETDQPRQVGDQPHAQAGGSDYQSAGQVGNLPRGADDSSAVKATPPQKEPDATLFPVRAPRGRRWRALDDFVVGPCNRVAHASAQAVVDNPAVDVNPLVLHGPVGTGKTHLLEGVYLGLKKKHPGWRVTFVTAEEFTNRFVQAMRLGKLAAFRKQFRDCDALLLDDLHFLASKRATQEEFLHTFDALHAEGKQLAVTCDVHPRLNEQFMPELVDRLLGGAVWGLLPPDFDTRLSLLRAKSMRPGQLLLGEDVILFLAEQLRGNVRELEGALHSIFHFSKVASRRIDRDLVREALGDLLRHSVRVIRVSDIDQAVCRVLGMAAGALQGNKRSWEFSHPRMVAMYLARKHTTAAYTEIGRHFGNRTHSTVVAAEKKVRQWLKDDGVLALGRVHIRVRDLVERVERALQP